MSSNAHARALITEAAPLLEPLLTTVAAGVIVVDMQADDAPIRYVNPAFERMTGYSSHDALGRNCRFLQGEGTDRDVVDQMRAASPPARTSRRRCSTTAATATGSGRDSSCPDARPVPLPGLD